MTWIDGSDVNSRATSTSPDLTALRLSGPPASSGRNSLKSSPYVFFRPTAQKGRWGHSGGPPRVSWDAIEPVGAADAGEAAVDGLAAVDGAVDGAAGDGLLPPDVHALTKSATIVAPRAALRNDRMGPPS